MKKKFEVIILKYDGSINQQIIDSVRNANCEYMFFLPESARDFPIDEIKKLAVLCKKNKTDIGALIAKQQTSLSELTVFPLVPWKKAYLYLPAITPTLSGKLIRSDLLKKVLPHVENVPCPDFMILHLMANEKLSVLETEKDIPENSAYFKSVWNDQKRWIATHSKPDLYETMYIMESQAARMALQLEMPITEFSDILEQESLLYILQNNAPEKIQKYKPAAVKKQTGKVRRIGIFCLALRTGGAERCAALMLEEWSKRSDLELTLFASSERQEKDYAIPANVRYIVLPKHFAQRMSQEQMLLQQYGIDTCIYLDHFWITTFYDISLAGHLGIRTIAMEHSSYPFCYYSGHPEICEIRDIVYKQADIVTCLSRADEFFWKQQGVHALYMPNPLTFSPETITPQKLTEKSLIFIARMLPEKGFADALTVTAEVRKKYPDVKLYMLGSFPLVQYKDKFNTLIAKYNLENNVETVGFTSDIQKYIRLSSIHLMPSMIEGYPMTVMEVKAFGVPTVLYSMPYLEAAKKEYGAISVPKQDPMTMAETVIRLFDDFNALNELGTKARESLRFFSNDVVFQRWNAVFESLEKGIVPEILSAPRLTSEEQMEFMRMEEQEIRCGLSHMFQNDEFMKKMKETVTKELEQEYPVLNLAFRLHRFLSPKIENNRILKTVFNGIVHSFIFCRKLIRCIIPSKPE